MDLDQYRVVLVNLNPTIGSEIRKTRPCVIISPDVLNRNVSTITVAPLTTKSRNYPTSLFINQNGKEAWVILDQIFTIDKLRVIKSFDKLVQSDSMAIKRIIKETFVD
jgi:mRNA interferase MazF